MPPISTLSTELPAPALGRSADRISAGAFDDPIEGNEPDFGADCRGQLLDRGTLDVLSPARKHARCVTGGELLDLRKLGGACSLSFHLQCTFAQCPADKALANAKTAAPLELRWQLLDADMQVMWESSSVACDSLDQRPAPVADWSALPLLPGAAYVRTIGSSCSPCAPRATLHFQINN
ncbi:MAG: hypothetical protein KC503_24395 [Myxococcales bacterium]|nr:hypothetical protein [Myxococcales bacterium]